MNTRRWIGFPVAVALLGVGAIACAPHPAPAAAEPAPAASEQAPVADPTPRQYTAQAAYLCGYDLAVADSLLPLALTVEVTLPTSVSPGQTIDALASEAGPAGAADYRIDLGTRYSDWYRAGKGSASVWVTVQDAQLFVADASGTSDMYVLPGQTEDGPSRLQSGNVIDLTTEEMRAPGAHVVDSLQAPFPSGIVVPADAGDSLTFSLGGHPNLGEYASGSAQPAEETRTNGCIPDPSAAPATFTVPVVQAESPAPVEEVPDRTLSASLSYTCDLNSQGLVTLPLTVETTMTVPERVAPGSSFRAPTDFTLKLTKKFSVLIRSYGSWRYLVGYSDNLEVNTTTSAGTASSRFPRISGKSAIPTTAFDVATLPTSTRIAIPESARGTATISGPSSEQIAHPRADIGGRIAFTVNAQIFHDEAGYLANEAPLYGILVCTPVSGADNVLGELVVDPELTPVIDDPDEDPEHEEVPVNVPEPVVQQETEVRTTDRLGAGTAASRPAVTAGAPARSTVPGLGISTAPAAQEAAPAETAAAEMQAVSFGTDASASRPRGDEATIDPPLLWGGIGLLLGVFGILRHHRRAMARILR